MAILTAVPGVQVTTTEPAPLLLAISILPGIDDSEPKFRVPRLLTGLAGVLPKAQPPVMVAETVKLRAGVVAASAG